MRVKDDDDADGNKKEYTEYGVRVMSWKLDRYQVMVVVVEEQYGVVGDDCDVGNPPNDRTIDRYDKPKRMSELPQPMCDQRDSREE